MSIPRLPLDASLDLRFDLSTIRGADYNPRAIDSDSIEALGRSIATLGVVKPVIQRRGTIVAGHQRTKAMRATGVTHAPVVSLDKDTTTYDEVRFNQMHNETDLIESDKPVRITGGFSSAEVGTYVRLPGSAVEGKIGKHGRMVRSSIAVMIQRYGSGWASCVAMEDGEVIHAQQTALACRMVGEPLLVYVLPNALREQAMAALSRSYGRHCYDSLPRSAFMQTFAQLNRVQDGKVRLNSRCYSWLLPMLEQHRELRVLDFGCGLGQFCEIGHRRGYKILGLEFFRRQRSKEGNGALGLIDVGAVNRMISTVLADVERNGRFDVVICDYVMNSVVSVPVELDVWNTLGAFVKPRGMVFVSGRFALDKQRWANLSAEKDHIIQRIDPETGLSGNFRKGRWFFQMYHTEERIRERLARMGWSAERTHGINKSSQIWNIQATTSDPCPVPKSELIASLRREFSMVYNDAGDHYQRADDVERVLGPLL